MLTPEEVRSFLAFVVVRYGGVSSEFNRFVWAEIIENAPIEQEPDMYSCKEGDIFKAIFSSSGKLRYVRSKDSRAYKEWREINDKIQNLYEKMDS